MPFLTCNLSNECIKIFWLLSLGCCLCRSVCFYSINPYFVCVFIPLGHGLEVEINHSWQEFNPRVFKGENILLVKNREQVTLHFDCYKIVRHQELTLNVRQHNNYTGYFFILFILVFLLFISFYWILKPMVNLTEGGQQYEFVSLANWQGCNRS